MIDRTLVAIEPPRPSRPAPQIPIPQGQTQDLRGRTLEPQMEASAARSLLIASLRACPTSRHLGIALQMYAWSCRRAAITASNSPQQQPVL